MVSSCSWLLKLAHELNIPVIITEQYPKGLGKTLSSLINSDMEAVEKVSFSCCQNQGFIHKWQNSRKNQAILFGIETHVCVLQTAIELKKMGAEVFVVANAVSSRNKLDHDIGLERMRQFGIQMLTKEMVYFEFLREAGTEQFKKMSTIFLRNK